MVRAAGVGREERGNGVVDRECLRRGEAERGRLVVRPALSTSNLLLLQKFGVDGVRTPRAVGEVAQVLKAGRSVSVLTSSLWAGCPWLDTLPCSVPIKEG